MSRENRDKLNHLLARWPDGVVMTAHWLVKHGYSFQLIEKYARYGWIKRIGQGAYTKFNDLGSWVGGVHALQEQLCLPVHVGGISALEINGFAQYLPLGDAQRNSITLYNTTEKRIKPSKWFLDAFTNCTFLQKNLFEKEVGLDKKEIDKIVVMVSAPERAILEVLSIVPTSFDYAHVYDLIENLQLLKPELMQELLQQCLSIKVKRLFIYLADKQQLPCFKYLNVNLIDLGKGKRVIKPGGEYIAKYELSVPLIQSERGEKQYDHL